MAEIKYGSLPFDEAVRFIRGKINLPTAAWTDIWHNQHDKAFVIAGAMKADLLDDFRQAVEKAIANGTTLAEFRKDFDAIVARHGWHYQGGRDWRTRVIYDTNLRQAYNAGREAKFSDPAFRKRRPYGLYRHNDAVERPRPEHLAWDGLVIPLDDPWWETHTPQNGWGCRCQKFALSERDLKRMGKSGPDTAPPVNYIDQVVGERGPSPRVVSVPEGIDPGFDYRPGASELARLRKQVTQKAEALPAQIGEALTEEIAAPPVSPLFGSEKQVKWAEEIREKATPLLERALTLELPTESRPRRSVGYPVELQQEVRAAIRSALRHVDAGDWIDWRNELVKFILQAHYGTIHPENDLELTKAIRSFLFQAERG